MVFHGRKDNRVTEKERIKRQIKRCQERLDTLKSCETHLSKYGYWDMGYFQGRLSILKDWLDELEENDDGK